MLSKPILAHFPAGTPQAERIQKVAPAINDMLEAFEANAAEMSSSMGVEDFDNMMMDYLYSAGLLEKGKIIQVDYVGVHPDNRERAMVVPVDAQDLLHRWATLDGFSLKKWRAFACTIPAGEMGQLWKDLNKQLAVASNGLLPPCTQELEVVTGRGSHSTTALRCAKFSAKAVHADLAGPDGCISTSKVVEMKPSFKSAFEQGVPYDVIPGELALACPKLMEILSRTGNSGNDVYREQTVLQLCARIHKLATAAASPDWTQIAKQAALGNGAIGMAKMNSLCDFVRAWSGGHDGDVLVSLETYERSLAVKRKLVPHELAALALIDLPDAPRFVPAMVKAMLNSPTCDSLGHSNLFNPSDFTSLGRTGKNRKAAMNANLLMIQAEQFLKAYSRLDVLQQAALTNKLEVRCVMCVHTKKVENRLNFASLDEIAMAFWEQAKTLDEKLPVWPRIKTLLAASTASASPSTKGCLREVRMDGSITESQLAQAGFKVGALIKNAKVDKDSVYMIKAIPANASSVLAELLVEEAHGEEDEEEDKEEQEELAIDRSELLAEWSVHVKVKPVFCTSYPCPSDSVELVATIIKGHIANSLKVEFEKSSEDNLTLMTVPRFGVFSKKAFKEGAMKIVGLSTNISVCSSDKEVPGLCLGSCLEGKVKVYIKSSNSIPKKSSSGILSTPFVAKYWEVSVNADARQTNCEHIKFPITFKVGKSSESLELPMITNTKPLRDEQELVVLKEHIPEAAAVEPVAKKPRVSAPKPKAKGKGKAKAKSK